MKKRFHAFHTRVFATVVLVAVVPIAVCLMLMLPLLIASSDRRQAQSAGEQLEAMQAQLGAVFEQTDALLDALSRRVDGEEDGRALYEAMVEAASGCAYVENLYVLAPDGACVEALRGGEARMDTDWGILAMAQEDTVFAPSAKADRIDAARKTREGFVLARLDGDALRAMLAAAHDSSCGVMLLTPQWRLILETQTAGASLAVLRERWLDGEALGQGDVNYGVRVEPVSGFTLLLSQPRTFTAETTRTVVLLGASMGALSLVLCVWAALVLSGVISRPVQEMTRAMARVQRGELSVRITPRTNDELGLLAQGFNRMVEEYEQNLRRTVERQKELDETRIRMMQAQLNPHFLYNTLDAMKWMGLTHGVPQVATLAQDLAKILRTSISGEEFVTLGCELELLERYIDIQLIRFEDRFACEIEVDDALMNLLVPKMVLQPIVENAVIHGVRDMDDGYIKVYARQTDGELHLFVQDNGRGMETGQSGALSFGVSGKPGEHLGLYNVDSILRLHFGDAYGLSIRSRPGEGCLVEVRLPARPAGSYTKEGKA